MQNGGISIFYKTQKTLHNMILSKSIIKWLQ